MSNRFYKLPEADAERSDRTPMAKLVAAVKADLLRRGEPVSLRILAKKLGTRPQTILRALREMQDGGTGAAETATGGAAETATPSDMPVAETATPSAAETATKALRKPHPPQTPHIEQSRAKTDNNLDDAAGAAPSAGDPQATLLPDDQPKQSRKAKANTDPRVAEFITWFAQEFERQAGRKYIVQGGKDGKLVKGLLARVGLEDLQRAARNMLTDTFWRNQADIATLSSKLNRFTGDGSNGNGHPGSQQGPARKAGGYQTAIDAQRAADAAKCGPKPRMRVITVSADDRPADPRVAVAG